MAEAVLEKAVCMSCGSDVRDGTYYCYACGKAVVTEPDEPTVLEDSNNAPIADDLVTSNARKSGKLATAAAERKRSRVGQRKPKQVVWEEPGAASNRVFILFCLLIFIFAGIVVFLTVFLK